MQNHTHQLTMVPTKLCAEGSYQVRSRIAVIRSGEGTIWLLYCFNQTSNPMWNSMRMYPIVVFTQSIDKNLNALDLKYMCSRV